MREPSPIRAASCFELSPILDPRLVLDLRMIGGQRLPPLSRFFVRIPHVSELERTSNITGRIAVGTHLQLDPASFLFLDADARSSRRPEDLGKRDPVVDFSAYMLEIQHR